MLTKEQLDSIERRDRVPGMPSLTIHTVPVQPDVHAALIAMARRCIELEERIGKVADSLENAAGNPIANANTERALRWAVGKIRGITEER